MLFIVIPSEARNLLFRKNSRSNAILRRIGPRLAQPGSVVEV